MLLRRSLLLGSLLLFSVALLQGCGDPQSKNNVQYGRFVNVLLNVPGNANVDFSSTKDSVAFNNLSYGGATDYYQGNYGTSKVSVMARGGSTPLLTQEINLEQFKKNTVIATGRIGGTGTLAPRIFALTDDFTLNGTAGDVIWVRLVNLSADAGAVDIADYDKVLQDPADPSSVISIGGPVAGLTNVTYGNYTAYVPVKAFLSDPKIPNKPAFDFRLQDNVTGAKYFVNGFNGGLISSPGAYTFLVVGQKSSVGADQLDVKILKDDKSFTQ